MVESGHTYHHLILLSLADLLPMPHHHAREGIEAVHTGQPPGEQSRMKASGECIWRGKGKIFHILGGSVAGQHCLLLVSFPTTRKKPTGMGRKTLPRKLFT